MGLGKMVMLGVCWGVGGCGCVVFGFLKLLDGRESGYG